MNWKFQRIIVIISFILLVGKFVAFFLTNSASVYSDAMESIVNVVAGFISLLSIHWAEQPRDKRHPFGHGKMELISASMEGEMIIIAGALIIYTGISRLLHPVNELPSLSIGIIIVSATAVINYLLGSWSIIKGKRTSSVALIASGKHLQSDTYSTLGLVAGLIIIQLTGLIIIDSLLALLFGSIIIVVGIKILRQTIANLVDANDIKELKNIADKINENKQDDWIDIHNLRVVSYGKALHIDCDVTLPSFYTIKQGHIATERLKDALQSQATDLYFTVHSDSCNESYCHECNLSNCPLRKAQCSHPFVFNVENITTQDED
jgi:cation diffusion facilitator family transporter